MVSTFTGGLLRQIAYSFIRPKLINSTHGQTLHKNRRSLFYSTRTIVETNDSTKILYDGECSLCLAEISVLRRLPSRKKLDFVDISKEEYKPELYHGVTYEDAMKEMHVISNGQVYVKAEAIRKMYDDVGLNWIANITRWPKVAPFCDKLYVKFARYRLKRALDNCNSDSCSVKLKGLREASEEKSGRQ